jgi:hypothetical protein
MLASKLMYFMLPNKFWFYSGFEIQLARFERRANIDYARHYSLPLQCFRKANTRIQYINGFQTKLDCYATKMEMKKNSVQKTYKEMLFTEDDSM